MVVDTTKNQRHPSVADSGNLYFSADYQSEIVTYDFLGTDIYVSRFENGQYLAPEKLNEKINSDFADYTPCIDPRERFLLFASNRPAGEGNSDIYLVMRSETGQWRELQNLGKLVNTPDNDHHPRLIDDGRYLLFTSDRRRMPPPGTKITYSGLKQLILGSGNGLGDIYLIGSEQLIHLSEE